MRTMDVRCIIDMAHTDGEVMYDDQYEVAGKVDVMPRGNGFAEEFFVYDISISAPGGLVDTSRAIPEMLPSSWFLEAEDALSEKAAEDLANGDGDDYVPDSGREY